MAERVVAPAPRDRTSEHERRSARRRLEELRELPAPPSEGRALPPEVQRRLAEHVDVDLSAVRLHHDWFGRELAAALDARAVAHGENIYLGSDAPETTSLAGRALLVHELFHAHGGDMVPVEEEAAAERAAVDVARADAIAAHDPEPLSRPDPHAGTGRLRAVGRKARATLARTDADGAHLPDVISAGEALVRLVGRLFDRDPDDHGGRLTSVLARLEPRLRRDVVTEVADRSGGHTLSQLHEVALRRPPEGGGHAEGAEPPERSAADAAPVETAPIDAAPVEAAPVEAAPVQAAPVEAAPVEAGEASHFPATKIGAATTSPADEEEAAQAEQPPSPAELAAAAPTVAPGAADGGAAKPAAGGAVTGESGPAPDLPTGAGAPEAAVADTGAAAGSPQPEQDAQDTAATDAEPAQAEPAEVVDEEDPAPESEPEPGPEAAEVVAAPDAADAGPPEAEPAAEPAAAEPTAAEPADAEPSDTESSDAEPADAEPADTQLAEADPAATEPTVAEPAEAPGNAPDDAPAAEGPGGVADPTSLDPAAVAEAAGITPVAGGEMTDPPIPAGGGGGGSAIADPPAPTAPDVSAMAPSGAMGAVAGLPATTLAATLPQVSGAAGREIGAETADLAATPPAMKRPSGVPADRDASLPPAPLPPLPQAKDHGVPVLASGPSAEPPVPEAPAAPPAPVTLRVPDSGAAGDKQITAEDAKRVQAAVHALPTHDPALDVDAGAVPELELRGGEDPKQVDDQADKVDEATTGVQSEGLGDARTDMGENDVFPQVPDETLTAAVGAAAPPAPGASPAASAAAASATIPSATPAPAAAPAAAPAGPAGTAGPGAPGGGGAEVPPAAVDAIAAEKSGDQISSAVKEQSGALGTARSGHDTDVEQAHADTDKQINDEIAANGAEQTSERRAVRKGVGEQRREWVGEQDRIAGESRTAAQTATKAASSSVGEARTEARTDAGEAIKDGNATIVKERSKAEDAAREERAKAERESDDGGFFSWLGSKVKSFVNKIKSAIHAVFELARKAVDAVISAAQKLAVAAIELGRRAVVAAINLAGKALMAAGDLALAAFPEARAKFRATIQKKVDGAKLAVNELADKLKAGVTKLLDALGGLLKGALTLLEKAYTAAIDVVGKVVDSAIKAAKAFVDALLDFAALIADIAADPVQWIKNLAAGFMDGVRNYVWSSLLGAVKSWFKEKVEEVVGVGGMILDLLRKGGITFGSIVTMAWTAIKESLPGIVIQLLIEKLVALLIPAGGAVSLIIDGIRAAWGAASKILAAFQKFIAFLKAVKGGKSGPLFGDLVGAAAVAVMDFLANFVLNKLKGAGQKVGGTLRKMAERIMKGLKKVATALKTGAKAAFGAVKRGAKAAVGLVKRGAAAVGRVARKVAPGRLLKAGAKAIGAVGRKVRGGLSKLSAKAKGAYGRAKEKLFGKRKPRKVRETPQAKLARVVGLIRPQIESWFGRGIGRIGLYAGLGLLRIRHGLRALKASWSGHQVSVRARVNPEAEAAVAWSPGSELRQVVSEAGERLLREPEVQERARAAAGLGAAGQTVPVRSGADFPGAASATGARVDRNPTSYLIGQHEPVKRGSPERTGTPLAQTPGSIGGHSTELFAQQSAAQARLAGAPSGTDPFTVAGTPARDVGKVLSLQGHQVADERKVGSYVKVDRTLARLAQRSTGDPNRGPAMLEAFIRTGGANLPRKSDRQALGRVAGLLGIVETARDPAHAADLAMATDLVGQPRGRLTGVIGGKPEDPITAHDLFTHPGVAGERPAAEFRGKVRPASLAGEPIQGGILPLTHRGAQAGAFHLAAGDAANADLMGSGSVRGSNQPRPALGVGSNENQRNASALAYRRMLLAERWAELRMTADPEAFKDRASALASIEARLREYYGIALSAPQHQLTGGRG